MTNKKCKNCNEIKDISDFPDYDNLCRHCRYLWKREYNDRIAKKLGISKYVIQRFGQSIVKLYERAGWKCEKCETNLKKLHVHHKDGKGDNYRYRTKEVIDNSLSNLVLLCSKCHLGYHAKERSLGKNGNPRRKG